jgi:hypothetical protein
MTQFFKTIAASFLLSVAAASAHATVVTMTSSGTVFDGTDYINTFHAGQNLAGLHYSQSITIDTALLQAMELGERINEVFANNHAISVLGNTTVAGVSYDWKISNGSAYVYLWNLFPNGYPLDQAGLNGQGINELDGQAMFGIIDMLSRTTPFLSSFDFAETRHFSDLTGINSYASFMTTGANGWQTFFDGTPDTLSWNVAQVPEPATLPSIALGLVLICMALRRRVRP